MSDLRKAAQQALEELENCSSEYGHRCNRCDSEVDEGGKVASALRAALAQQAEPEPLHEQDIEDAIEAAYWHFDARKKGLNEWASAPQSERDAFKAEARKLAKGYFPTRQVQDTKREMLAVANAFIRGKRAALAQQAEPVQEPVAWMCSSPELMAKGYKRFSSWCEGDWNIPVYAAPPQRKPLTEEEILKAIGWERAEMYMKLTPNFPIEEARKETIKNARAIERAHGIGEQP